MIKLVEREWRNELDAYVKSYICDSERDVASLPACCTESTAFVVGSGKAYMVNASGVWAEIGGEG